jgi:hypothetical protein
MLEFDPIQLQRLNHRLVYVIVRPKIKHIQDFWKTEDIQEVMAWVHDHVLPRNIELEWVNWNG